MLQRFRHDIRFRIEEDAIAAEHVVGIAIFFDDPISIELGYCIGAEWMKGAFCSVALPRLCHRVRRLMLGRFCNCG